MTRPVQILLLVTLLAPVASAQGNTKNADAALQKSIDEAIDEGSAWLKTTQLRNGSFPSAYNTAYPMGPTALCTLALLHSRIPRKDESIVKAIDYLHRVAAKGGSRTGLRTYSVSIAIMALVRLGMCDGAPIDAKKGPGGFWLESRDRKLLENLTRWLIRRQSASGGWRYPEGDYDTSCSQYAVLALHEARRAGLSVPRETFERALRLFVGIQESKGKRVPRFEESGGDGVYGAMRSRAKGYDETRGWGYVGRSAATHAMTTAGVAILAITKDSTRSKRLLAKAEQGIRDGIAWLGARFQLTTPGWNYYYIYGLERAGVLADVVYMGRHRWYAEGAAYLCRIRKSNAGWSMNQRGMMGRIGSSTTTIDTSFALLFLTRATAKSVATPTPPELLNLTEGAKLDDRAHADLFKAAFTEMERLDEEGRKKRAGDFAFLGPRVIGHLLPKLMATSAITRHRAIRILRAVTGYEIGYDPDAPEDTRDEAAERWTKWYLLNRGKLKLDREKRLIR